MWWFYRNHGPLMLAIALVTSIPMLIVAIPTVFVTAQVMRQQFAVDPLFSGTVPEPAALRSLEELNRSMLAIGAIGTVIGTMSVVAAGAALAWLVREVEDGRRPSLAGSLDAVVDRLRPLVGIWAVLAALGLVGQAFFGVLNDASARLLFDPGPAMSWLLVGFLGVVVWLIVDLTLVVRWSGAIPAIVFDALGARAALTRSWRWTDGNGWKIFGLLVLAFLAALLVVLVPVGIAAVIMIPSSASGATPLLAASAVLNWAATAVVMPIFAVLLARVYLDLRSQFGST